MERKVIDGVVMPSEEDEEKFIILPSGFNDVIIVKEHMVTQGEVVKSCNMSVENPVQKVGQEVMCPSCGKKFKIVKQEDLSKEI